MGDVDEMKLLTLILACCLVCGCLGCQSCGWHSQAFKPETTDKEAWKEINHVDK